MGGNGISGCVGSVGGCGRRGREVGRWLGASLGDAGLVCQAVLGVVGLCVVLYSFNFESVLLKFMTEYCCIITFIVAATFYWHCAAGES